MLKVPQKVDHALLLLRRLAEAGEAPLSLEDVAKAEKVSQGYLEEVARLLRAAGLVKGRRGARGGYVLARDPRDITVADVVIAVERHTWVDACVGIEAKRAATGIAARHSSHDALWHKVQGQVMTTLRAVTIAELASAIASAAKRSRTPEIASSLRSSR